MSEIIKEGDKVTVKPGMDVVASMANDFRTELHSVVQESPKEVLIDLSGVEMVDSVGIGIIIATHNSINKAGGKLKVINVIKDIYSLFSTMRLDHHFDVEQAD
jgi:anti-sigma B factor antagonist